jgi:Tol biopolymer transport system component
MPMSWSPATNVLLFYATDPKTNNDVWALPMTGERKPYRVLDSTFGESHPQISPDGKWVAYWSGETGRGEIYVQSSPPGAGKFQISTNGGVYPRWRGDGRELFFMESSSFSKLMAAAITTGAKTLESSTPMELFDSLYNNAAIPGHSGNWSTFAVSADGKKFLIPRPEANAPIATVPITAVVNWTSSIKE